ncbi:MAG: CDP-alcohol phosphatidyltransferase [Gammaproteobacteria bacterium]|nr:CDP-alcohol phosphatidyltransferase [Gammaproteobacteria bacterium]|tara:strand:- start:1730 stop:2302 length:573 start_codon:yes stop_codon:yes gene_type:complete
MIFAAQIPNAITVFRIVLVVPTGWLMLQEAYIQGFILMMVASASDALDGWLARHFNWTSRFGAAMDPVADKLLVGTMFVVFWIQGHIPAWLAFIVITRDVLILVGAGTYRWLFERIDFAPTYLSKANTAVQIVMLLLLLIYLCDVGVISQLSGAVVDPYCFLLVAFLGVSSGVDYVVTWTLRAWRKVRTR